MSNNLLSLGCALIMINEDDDIPADEPAEDEVNDLRTENELKRIKLSLEHGTEFNMPEDKDVPPELESIWLDYIQQFEDEFAKSTKVTVFDFIGRPAFVAVAELADHSIESALDGLVEIMNRFNVVVDTICDVEDRELYRFITEELFLHETNDIKIDGMKHYFIYEEFHPNHEYDIKNHGLDFVRSLLDKERDWMPNFLGLAQELEAQDGTIDQKEAIRRMENFRASFSGFEIKELEFTAITIREEDADAAFFIVYTAYIEGSDETMELADTGNLHLIMEHGYWSINRINLPGLTL